jgi:hypothetical protein
MDHWKQGRDMASLDTSSKRDWKWWEIVALAVAPTVGLLIAFFLLRWWFP